MRKLKIGTDKKRKKTTTPAESSFVFSTLTAHALGTCRFSWFPRCWLEKNFDWLQENWKRSKGQATHKIGSQPSFEVLSLETLSRPVAKMKDKWQWRQKNKQRKNSQKYRKDWTPIHYVCRFRLFSVLYVFFVFFLQIFVKKSTSGISSILLLSTFKLLFLLL